MGQVSETLFAYVMSVITPLTLGLTSSHGGESGDIMKECDTPVKGDVEIFKSITAGGRHVDNGFRPVNLAAFCAYFIVCYEFKIDAMVSFFHKI